MQVRNPDPAVNSLFGRQRFWNQDKASEGRSGEERTRVSTAAVNRPRLTDECRRE